MAATERRIGSSRRGMTVLGKVPVVPKPINLPSQRLENQGLSPDVDIVPRGTYTWGSAGQFPGSVDNKSRKSDSASSNPSSSGGEQGNCRKVESKSISSGNCGVKVGGGLSETSVQFSSANPITGQALERNGKIEEPRNSNSYTPNSSDGLKQQVRETPIPKSGDGNVCGVSNPPGHCGPHGNHSSAGVSASDVPSHGVGAGTYPNTSQQNGFHSFPGVPQHNEKKEREIIVIHMVGSPGFHGNYYPPQFGYPDAYNRNGLFGNVPLQFGNFEPCFGFHGHGRLDGGGQISTVTGSDFFDDHEDFICYEKECYQGRKKKGLLRGSLQESPYLCGGQRDVHDPLISHSSPRPRSSSQKHSSRNIGKVRSLYHNGRLVPIEEASAVPVPEKRITLLTKVSQPQLLTIKSLDESSGSKVARAENVVDFVSSACGDEGKAPETADAISDGIRVEGAGASASLKIADEISLPVETTLGTKEVSVLKTRKYKCLHCKPEAVAHEGPASMVCQACKKTTVCESTLSTSQCCLIPTKEVPTESIDNSNSMDGCVVEVKHVILDADSSSLTTVKGQEDVSSISSTEAIAAEKQLDSMTLTKSLTQNDQEGNGKQTLSGKNGVTYGKWKLKRPAGAAKVAFKLFTPRIRKSAGRKNTLKTFAGECVSEASSSASCNEEDSRDNVGADPIRLSSYSKACSKCKESLSPSSLYSSGDIPVDDFHEFAKETPNGVAVDCIASEGRVQKKKDKNTNETPCEDCHDNVATVQTLVKTVFEEISNTEVQKQEPKGAESTNEKAWKPKMLTALQSKSASNASGIRPSKARVVAKKHELQGRKSQLAFGLAFSSESPPEAAKEQNTVDESSSLSTSQFCNSEVLKPNKSQCFVPQLKSSGRGQQILLFRKRLSEQAAVEQQPCGKNSSVKQPVGLLAASSKGKFGQEHTKQSLYSTSSSQNNLPDVKFSDSASKHHNIRRRIYHVVQGFGSYHFIASSSLSAKMKDARNNRSLQDSSMPSLEELGKKTVSLSSGSSCTVSEHSEEVLDATSVVEITSCRAQSESAPNSKQASVGVYQPTSVSILSSSVSEKRNAKNHVRPSEQFSVWKPKATAESGASQKLCEGKDNDESRTSISTHVEGPSKEIKNSVSSSQVSASSHLHVGENNEEHTIDNVCRLPLELESGSHQALEEIEEDALLSVENKVVDSQKLSEIVVSMEEVEHSSVLKEIEPVPVLESSGPVIQQTTQDCSQENTSGNHRPFLKKKNVMSHEKANRYHQMMFKKYKETGHWKPKGELHSKVQEKRDCGSQNDREAAMKVALLVA